MASPSSESIESANRTPRRLARLVPGLSALSNYRFSEDLRHDVMAGLSVAAVALPVSIAYAQLAGFDPVVGLYSSILPLVAYAIFGTSRQLMVNPDAAVCAMIAAAIAPLAGNNAELYLSLTTALTLLTGVFCIVASYFRLGALADFLSKPILVGFLNGIAISIFLGQIGKLLGFSVESSGIVPVLIEVLRKITLVHGPTLMVGLGSFAVLFACLRWLPRIPAALAALVLAGATSAVLDLEAQGVAVLGPVPAGLPPIHWPTVPLQDVASLAADAAGLALVVFTSGTLTARSFAAKGGYLIDVDREFRSLRRSEHLVRTVARLCRNRGGFAHRPWGCRRWTHSGDRAGRRDDNRGRAPVPYRTAAICARRFAGGGADFRGFLAVRRGDSAGNLEV